MAASREQLAASGADSIPTEDDMERPGLRIAPLRVCHGASVPGLSATHHPQSSLSGGMARRLDHTFLRLTGLTHAFVAGHPCGFRTRCPLLGSSSAAVAGVRQNPAGTPLMALCPACGPKRAVELYTLTLGESDA
jgi:hypothetical protein